MSEITVTGLTRELHDLVNWETFALHLPDIRQSHIDIIKKDNPLCTVDQKRELYDKWLRLHPSPSWEHVVLALELAGETKLATDLNNRQPVELMESTSNVHEMDVDEDVVLKLSELHGSFASLEFETIAAFEKVVQSGEVQLSQLVQRVSIERAYKCDLNELLNRNIATTTKFFDIISQCYHFLDIYLLLVLVNSFLNPSKLLQDLNIHNEDIKSFKSSTEVRSLYKTLRPFTSKLPSDAYITLRVENCWGENEMWLVEKLLQTAFRMKHSAIQKWFRVIPGSLIIVLLTSRHTARYILSRPLTRHQIDLLKYLGVISVQVDHTYIMDEGRQENYSFIQGLLQAVKEGHFKAAKFLLEEMNVDMNSIEYDDGIKGMYSTFDDINDIDSFVDDNNNNCSNYVLERMSPLAIATCNGDYRMVQLLIKHAPDDKALATASTFAVLFPDSKMILFFFMHMIRINCDEVPKGITALHFLAMSPALLEKYVERKDINPNVQSSIGTPLHMACGFAQLRSVEIFLDAKANPNVQDVEGITALLHAVVCTDKDADVRLQIVDLLLKAKANPDIPDNNGRTPLHAASDHEGNLAIVNQLLQAGASVNAQTNIGETSLHVASRSGTTSIVKALLDFYADPDLQTIDGYTPLCVASHEGRLAVVEQLLKVGADMNISSSDGMTAVDMALDNEHSKVVELLLKYTSDNH